MHADPRSARDFRAALARWQESGELPANRQIAVMVALATLDRSILKRLHLRPEQAWNELDAPARTVIASWARRNDSAGTEPTRERLVAPTTGKRVPRHMPTATQLREMRRQRGEQQRVFWSRFGVTQSGGSRYEADRELNAPLGLLLALWESGALSPEDLDEIVPLVRFPGWLRTQAVELDVKKALRKALFKYKLHADEELFEKAYSYIRQYY